MSYGSHAAATNIICRACFGLLRIMGPAPHPYFERSFTPTAVGRIPFLEMYTLSRLRRYLSERPPPLRPASDSQRNLCERCKSLQLLSHLERPWALSSQVLDRSLKIGDFDQGSIDSPCALCAEFHIILCELAFDDHQDRSCQLYRIFSISLPLMTEFMIQPTHHLGRCCIFVQQNSWNLCSETFPCMVKIGGRSI
jgi:hypothetical protein